MSSLHRVTVYCVLFIWFQFTVFCSSSYSLLCFAHRVTVYCVLLIGLLFSVFCSSGYSLLCSVLRVTVYCVLLIELQYMFTVFCSLSCNIYLLCSVRSIAV